MSDDIVSLLAYDALKYGSVSGSVYLLGKLIFQRQIPPVVLHPSVYAAVAVLCAGNAIAIPITSWIRKHKRSNFGFNAGVYSASIVVTILATITFHLPAGVVYLIRR